MTAPVDAACAVVAALDPVPGLRAANPAVVAATPLAPRRLGSLAVDLTPDLVEVRVVGLALPLGPALGAAEIAVRAALRATEWANATVRIVDADLDATALGTSCP